MIYFVPYVVAIPIIRSHKYFTAEMHNDIIWLNCCYFILCLCLATSQLFLLKINQTFVEQYFISVFLASPVNNSASDPHLYFIIIIIRARCSRPFEVAVNMRSFSQQTYATLSFNQCLVKTTNHAPPHCVILDLKSSCACL